MPTTRSGAQYGPGTSGTPKKISTAKQALSISRKSKLKTAVKTYSKMKPQPLNLMAKKEVRATKAKQAKDVKKKKEVQYKKPLIKTSVKKASKIQAVKRKEVVDKKRFRGPRIQSDGADFPDSGTSKSITVEDKPGYIFMQQQVDPDNDDQPVGLYRVEVIGEDTEVVPPRLVEWGAFRLKLVPNTYFSVMSMSKARSAVCRELCDFSSRNLRDGWFKVSEEELDGFIDMYIQQC